MEAHDHDRPGRARKRLLRQMAPRLIDDRHALQAALARATKGTTRLRSGGDRRTAGNGERTICGRLGYKRHPARTSSISADAVRRTSPTCGSSSCHAHAEPRRTPKFHLRRSHLGTTAGRRPDAACRRPRRGEQRLHQAEGHAGLGVQAARRSRPYCNHRYDSLRGKSGPPAHALSREPIGVSDRSPTPFRLSPKFTMSPKAVKQEKAREIRRMRTSVKLRRARCDARDRSARAYLSPPSELFGGP